MEVYRFDMWTLACEVVIQSLSPIHAIIWTGMSYVLSSIVEVDLATLLHCHIHGNRPKILRIPEIIRPCGNCNVQSRLKLSCTILSSSII